MSLRVLNFGPRLASTAPMMGVTRHFAHAIDLLDAGEPMKSSSPQLYVMPAPQPRPDDDVVPFPVKSGKLLQLPSRWNGSVVRMRPQRQYRGNTVDWPRGYPTHDDL